MPWASWRCCVPLPMVWFLVRDKPEEHPAINPAEVTLIKAGSIEANDDAPGRILKTRRQRLDTITASGW